MSKVDGSYVKFDEESGSVSDVPAVNEGGVPQASAQDFERGKKKLRLEEYELALSSK